MKAEDRANIDSMTRQVAINEWEYKYKLEMLFILQVIFIGLMVITIAAILSKYGFFDYKVVILVGIIVVVVDIGVVIFRSMYTKNVRDQESWSKRYFKGDGSETPAVSPQLVQAAATSANQICTAVQSGNIANALSNPSITTSSSCPSLSAAGAGGPPGAMRGPTGATGATGANKPDRCNDGYLCCNSKCNNDFNKTCSDRTYEVSTCYNSSGNVIATASNSGPTGPTHMPTHWM